MKQIKRGEIYFADLSPVVGSEQTGLRPVLILQNNSGNKHSPTTIVAAITSSRTKHRLPTHVTFTSDCLPYQSTVLAEQIRTVDKERLGKRIGKIDRAAMKNVDHAIAIRFGIDKTGECRNE